MNHSLMTLPEGLCVRESGIPNAGLGVWAATSFPARARFGPYSGEIIHDCDQAHDSGYCWQVYKNGKPYHFIDAHNPKKANWMRYVNCARSESEQNVTAYQHNGEIYYRSFKSIEAGSEILVWYGHDYGKELGIERGSDSKIFSQIKIKVINGESIYQCIWCKGAFSRMEYLLGHMRSQHGSILANLAFKMRETLIFRKEKKSNGILKHRKQNNWAVEQGSMSEKSIPSEKKMVRNRVKKFKKPTKPLLVLDQNKKLTDERHHNEQLIATTFRENDRSGADNSVKHEVLTTATCQAAHVQTHTATESYTTPVADVQYSRSCPSFIWARGDDDKFINALQRPDIQGRINNAMSRADEANSAVENLNDILLEAAKIAGIRQKSVGIRPHPPKKKSNNKCWFDSDCKMLKGKLASFGRRLRQQPYNIALLFEFRALRKQYRSLINRKKSVFKQDILHQMDTLNSNNPREYWSLFNKLRDLDNNGKPNNPISNSDWVTHFSQLLNNSNKEVQANTVDLMDDFINSHKDEVFNELNFSITAEEVSKAISSLKCGKAAGFDLILSEMLKAGHTALLPLLVKTFNVVLSSGCFPDTWRCNILQPLHKKGDKLIPSNYRGIAVGSHLSKLFCNVLHKRLYTFSETHALIPDCQIGFMRGARTADHILTLKCIVDKFVNKASKEYLYCCFVDFKAAFDSISRKALVYKLVKLGIGGNFLSTIQNLYSKVLYAVKVNGRLSDDIISNVGVKQGCVLSPLLFNLYLHDLPSIFEDCDPIRLHDTDVSCLLYADDLVIVSRSYCGLQRALNNLSDYCQKWDLTVNLDKTKIIIFNRGGRRITRHSFSYRGIAIETVQSYCYLGIIFSSAGNFKQACDRLVEQASKALFKLKSINVRDNISVAYRLFYSLILPILRYGSEVWCPFYIAGLNETNFMNICDGTPIEKIWLRFGKYLLGCNRTTSNAAVRGELGQYPLLLALLPHAVKYWLSLCAGKKTTLCWMAYLDSYTYLDRIPNWSQCIHILLSKFDLGLTWDNQGALCINRTVRHLHTALELAYNNQWTKFVNDSDKNPKLRTYKLFKTCFKMENYVLYASKLEDRKQFSKLRLSAHSLRVEKDRHCWPKVPLEARKCLLCNSGCVEDEKHFIMSCDVFQTQRVQFFNSLSECSIFNDLDFDAKFAFIMSCNGGDMDIMKLSLPYVNVITDIRSTHLI
ncbi:hypothetical protein ScPMuIL_016783 [Solemya velum]